jgi:hypothetical protein
MFFLRAASFFSILGTAAKGISFGGILCRSSSDYEPIDHAHDLVVNLAAC